MARHFALIPAAGSGSRVGEELPKQYLTIAGRTILRHAVEPFCALPEIEAVFVVLSPADARFDAYDWSTLGDKLRPLRCGGSARAESVLNGIRAVAAHLDDEDWLLVHDAARPCITSALIRRLMEAVGDDEVGGLLALPVADTLKKAEPASSNGSAAENRIAATVPRHGLWQAQTPQMFRVGVLRRALEALDLHAVTDEASAVEQAGLRPLLVTGDARNLKVTYSQDLAVAEKFLEKSDMRIGQGFDVHALVSGRPLIIGGVTIPFERGLEGHSDADVLLHAVCDALLGAAGLGDIGRHFPDTDAHYKGADSRVLLRAVGKMLKDRGLVIGNLDATIIAQAPRMAPHIPAMCSHMAADLEVDPACVNVKAKTTERLGFTGRGEGIAAEAIALLR
jgi:2-C-methyl-D-erythritol 4-phosphate cytidylyltransferase/2-C-methyl-D-erythritol 2,4-cyclodiphosphate synthase